MAPSMYRHSLFFDDEGKADSASVDIFYQVEQDILEVYQCEDTDTGILEVRFWTEKKIDQADIDCLLASSPPNSYALNCDDYL